MSSKTYVIKNMEKHSEWKGVKVTGLLIICLLSQHISTTLSATSTLSPVSGNVTITCAADNKSLNTTNYIIESMNGDVILSILTKDVVPTQLIRAHLNGLIDHHNITIGFRIINIKNTSILKDILSYEVQYLQKCTNISIGIIIADDLWWSSSSYVSDIIEKLKYNNIWHLPSPSNILYSKIVHILYELPWDNLNTSIDIQTHSIDARDCFLEALYAGHLCVTKHFIGEENIIILIDDIFVHGSVIFNENDTIFVVPFPIPVDKNSIDELPDESYIFVENEIVSKSIDSNENDMKFRPSIFLTLSSVLFDVITWLNEEISKNSEFLIWDDNDSHNNNNHNNINDINKKIWPNNEIKINPLDMLISNLHLENLMEDFNLDLLQKHHPIASSSTTNQINDRIFELRHIASINFFSNITTFYHYQNHENETLLTSSSPSAAAATKTSNSINNRTKLGQILKCSSLSVSPSKPSPTLNNTTVTETDFNNNNNIQEYLNNIEMYWKIKSEAWVAAGLTIAILGVVISLSILIFIIVRISMDDVLEGNPIGTLLLIISIIILFCSFIPFSMEYTCNNNSPMDSQSMQMFNDVLNVHCSVKVFIITLCYSIVFSVLLCRTVMLASIGSEGGFLSHVNGYIQSIICLLSTLVQVGLSTELLIFMYTATNGSISCDNIYYGNWFWALLAYDFCLLLILVILLPYMFRSQRNYREGFLILIGIILCLIVWSTWIPIASFGNWWRDFAVPLGAQGTGWAILGGILIPRTFLIVRGIARSDLAQALPSLTSLSFANNNNNQYVSEQSIYECVNPAMRQRVSDDSYSELERNRCHSPGEIPTLPLRATARKTNNNHNHNNNANLNVNQYAYSSEHSSITTQSKATRF